MKRVFIKIAILFSLLAALSLCFSACSDDNSEPGQTEEPEGGQDPDNESDAVVPTNSFTLTTLTHNSLSISYGSSNATACYLLVVEANESVDEQAIIERGESVEVNCEGTYTVENLTPATYYCIEFLSVNEDKSSRLSLQFTTPAEPE
ncbi:MAG: hypothetical protein E7131_04265 [Rikenellaceae bacterium]|nr:hypothetical protein [Rikenellaceae bacterium]